MWIIELCDNYNTIVLCYLAKLGQITCGYEMKINQIVCIILQLCIVNLNSTSSVAKMWRVLGPLLMPMIMDDAISHYNSMEGGGSMKYYRIQEVV